MPDPCVGDGSRTCCGRILMQPRSCIVIPGLQIGGPHPEPLDCSCRGPSQRAQCSGPCHEQVRSPEAGGAIVR